MHRAHLVEREIGGLRSFDNKGVVKLFDVRDVDVDGRTQTALFCEYIEGGDVGHNYRTNQPTQEQILEFATALLQAVHVVHKSERIHRDLKLENIILRNSLWEAPVLIDFGLSKSATDSTLTAYPSRIGSLFFMSPEQLAGERARKASDLWACGVILYIVLTRRHPYLDDIRGLSEDDVADAIAGPPRPLPTDTLAPLADIIMRLLSEEPYERGSARRALKDLRKAMK